VPIDTDAYSRRLRAACVDPKSRRLLIADLRGSQQEEDLTEPVNCAGVGRIRHFRRTTSPGWPANSLPLDPAAKALAVERCDVMRAQAFQNAACNWRCWYCFVDFQLLAADQRRGEWVTAETLVSRYLEQSDPPQIIDLTGGQPDLVPEWVPWMMEAIEAVGYSDKVYLWSDDNLSNDYFWRYLTDDERGRLAANPRYGRVCCFKGFDSESFAFNTAAEPDVFERQFSLFERLAETGMDLYAYATFTSPSSRRVDDGIRRFVDRLQSISPRLPLRTVPLEVRVFTPVVSRLREDHQAALGNQWRAIERWTTELESRFSADDRSQSIADIAL
jgi:uncharacterized Fe-S cluster-containing radical SAM superfamily protein